MSQTKHPLLTAKSGLHIADLIRLILAQSRNQGQMQPPPSLPQPARDAREETDPQLQARIDEAIQSLRLQKQKEAPAPREIRVSTSDYRRTMPPISNNPPIHNTFKQTRGGTGSGLSHLTSPSKGILGI